MDSLELLLRTAGFVFIFVVAGVSVHKMMPCDSKHCLITQAQQDYEWCQNHSVELTAPLNTGGYNQVIIKPEPLAACQKVFKEQIETLGAAMDDK